MAADSGLTVTLSMVRPAELACRCSLTVGYQVRRVFRAVQLIPTVSVLA